MQAVGILALAPASQVLKCWLGPVTRVFLGGNGGCGQGELLMLIERVVAGDQEQSCPVVADWLGKQRVGRPALKQLLRTI